MTTPIKPLADRVVAVREKAPTQTASGIYLPESASEKPTMATVVAVGRDVEEVAIDDSIVYTDFNATELTVEGSEYLVVKEADVLATVRS